MEDADVIECHTYTSARRHPHVVGVIGGWVSPWPLTPTQIGVLIGSAVALIFTHSLWGLLFPGFLQVLVIGGVPITLTWMCRHLRIDGRSPVRAASGAINYLSRPRHGIVHGRPLRAPRPRRTDGRTFVHHVAGRR